ncbi:MAG: hypothetical protein M3O46_22870 [Myxococcota bacterium]|nr:hypothetical protein [Myxococcota bacterium]
MNPAGFILKRGSAAKTPFRKSAFRDFNWGIVILEFTVSAEGHAVVSWPPFAGVEAAHSIAIAAASIRRASPLPPIAGGTRFARCPALRTIRCE